MSEVTILQVGPYSPGNFPTGNVHLHLGFIPDKVVAKNISGTDLTTMEWWAGGTLIKSQPGQTAFTGAVTHRAITTSAIKAYTAGQSGALGITLAFTADTDLYNTAETLMLDIYRNGPGAPGTAVIAVVT